MRVPSLFRIALLLAVVPSAALAFPVDPSLAPQLTPVEVGGKNLPGIVLEAGKNTIVQIPLPEDQQDWQGQMSITLKLFNAAPSDAEFLIFLRDGSDPKEPTVFPRRYFWTKLRADWSGSKEFNLNLEDFIPSTGAKEDGLKRPPTHVGAIGFCNQIGPSDPVQNSWGIPVAKAVTLGIESITLE